MRKIIFFAKALFPCANLHRVLYIAHIGVFPARSRIGARHMVMWLCRRRRRRRHQGGKK